MECMSIENINRMQITVLPNRLLSQKCMESSPFKDYDLEELQNLIIGRRDEEL